MLKRYSRAPMTRYQWMFGDRTGASAIIEGDAVLPIRGRYQVVTNFRQSEHPDGEGYECHRFRVANAMLASLPEVGVDEVRRVLAATHSEGQDPTVYSYIADLVRGVVYLYHFHNFENVVVLDVAKELEKGAHVYDLPEMFPKTVAAMTFDYLARKELADKKAARLDPRFDATTLPAVLGTLPGHRPRGDGRTDDHDQRRQEPALPAAQRRREVRGAPRLADVLLPARLRRDGPLLPVHARPCGEGDGARHGRRRALPGGDAGRVGSGEERLQEPGSQLEDRALAPPVAPAAAGA